MSMGSYGKTWLTHETTRWLHAWTAEPSTCDTRSFYAFTTGGRRQSGYDLARFSHLVFVFPHVRHVGGRELQRERDLAQTRHPYRRSRRARPHIWATRGGPGARPRRRENYANPYSVMGHGQGIHFNGVEKWSSAARSRRASRSRRDVLDRRARCGRRRTRGAIAVHDRPRRVLVRSTEPLTAFLAYGRPERAPARPLRRGNVLLGPVGAAASEWPERSRSTSATAIRRRDACVPLGRPDRDHRDREVRVKGQVVEWTPSSTAAAGSRATRCTPGSVCALSRRGGRSGGRSCRTTRG